MKKIRQPDENPLGVHDRRENRMRHEPLPLAVLDEHAEVAVAESELLAADRVVAPLPAIGGDGRGIVGLLRQESPKPLVRLVVNKRPARPGRLGPRRQNPAVEIPVLARDQRLVIAADLLEQGARDDAQTVNARAGVERSLEIARRQPQPRADALFGDVEARRLPRRPRGD